MKLNLATSLMDPEHSKITVLPDHLGNWVIHPPISKMIKGVRLYLVDCLRQFTLRVKLYY